MLCAVGASTLCIHQLCFALDMIKFIMILAGISNLILLFLLVGLYGLTTYILLLFAQLMSVIIGKCLYINKMFRREEKK